MSKRHVVPMAILSIALASSLLSAAQSGKTPRLTADDYIEIQQLYTDYAYALDEGRGDRLAETFVDEGEFVGGRAAAGQDRVRKGKEELARLGNAGGGMQYRHFLTNLHITRTAEGANASCYFLEFNVKTNPATFSMSAIFEDTLVKTPQGWKFKKRIVWREDNDKSPFRAQLRPETPEKK